MLASRRGDPQGLHEHGLHVPLPQPIRQPGPVRLRDDRVIDEGHPVHVVVHRGSRHDLGNPGGYLKAAVDFALERDDYGPELRRWLVERLGLAEN